MSGTTTQLNKLERSAEGLGRALNKFGIELRWNTRAARLEMTDDGTWYPVDDLRFEKLRDRLNTEWKWVGKGGQILGADALHSMMRAYAYDFQQDPFETWLAALPSWDGKGRWTGC